MKWGCPWSHSQICHCPLKRHNVTAGHPWHLETRDSYHQERWWCPNPTHHFDLQWQNNPPWIFIKLEILDITLHWMLTQFWSFAWIKVYCEKFTSNSFPVYRLVIWAIMGFSSPAFFIVKSSCSVGCQEVTCFVLNGCTYARPSFHSHWTYIHLLNI